MIKQEPVLEFEIYNIKEGIAIRACNRGSGRARGLKLAIPRTLAGHLL